MALANPLESFIWGSGGARKTPEEIARDREIAAALMAQGVDTSPIGHWSQGAARVVSALGGVLKERRAGKASETNASESQSRIAKLLGGLGGGTDPTSQFPPAPGAQAAPMDYASQRVSQAHGSPDGGGDIEGYIRQAAASRGIDPNIAVAVAKSEGGLKDPFRQSDVVKNGVRERSYGPFQLYMDGGLGSKALEAGIDPRQDWKRGVDFALDQAATGGWGPWYGAKKIGVTGMQGIGQPPAAQSVSGPPPVVPGIPGQQTMPLGAGAAPPPAQAPQMPPQAPSAAPMPEMAGNVPQPIQMAQAGGLNPAIIEALSSPYASAQERSIAGILLEQEMKRQAQANDPNAGLDAEYKRMQIKKLESDIATANSPDARKKFGLNPQYGVDAQGNPVLLQLGENGQAQQTQLPPGVSLSKEPIRLDAGTHWVLLDPITRQPVGQVQKNTAGEAAAGEAGKAQGQAQAGLGNAEAGYNTAVEQIDAILNHPGLDSSVGTLQGRIPDALAGAMNSDVADFRARVGQLQGQTFLRAFEALKGGGAITEIEGKKAEQAIGRLNQAVSETDFKAALSDLRTILDRGMEAYRRKAGVVSQPADGWQDIGGGVRMRVKQ